MSALGLIGTAAPLVPQAPAKAPPELQLRLEDALTSAERLWVRGRLIGPPGWPRGSAEWKHWWERWRGKPAPVLPAPAVHLETRIGNSNFVADASLLEDNRFEALVPVHLPPARRGWRSARYQVTCAGLSAESSGVVLAPPEKAVGAVVVLLPLEYTFEPLAPQRLANSEFASRLAKLLRGVDQGPRGFHPIYYLACVPRDTENRQAELALAATAIGWPSGNFVLLPCELDSAKTAFSYGIDRLRWLFAGRLDLLVLNFEPLAAKSLKSLTEPAADRAIVRSLVNPEDDPWKIIDQPTADQLRFQTNGLHPTRASLLPRYPIVFCHGMLAFSTLKMQLPEDLNCFAPLREFLRDRGFRVLFPQVPPTSGVLERAASLREQILRWTDEPVNMVAHSMGGLDARYMITHLGMAEKVRSLTTVSTPHHGTALADWFLTNFRQRVPLVMAMEAFGVSFDGFRDCRLAACKEFNEKTPDRPEVRYFSYGGEVPQSKVSPVLRRAWTILTTTEGPNDGMVSTASAHWGEYLGTVHADHFAQTPDAVFLRPGEDFDSLGFYSRLVEDLARRGY